MDKIYQIKINRKIKINFVLYNKAYSVAITLPKQLIPHNV